MAASTTGAALKKSIPLLSRFEGAMVGAVLGDCLGARFEYKEATTLDEIRTFFAGIGDKENESVTHQYTDDTAMARSVASSLIAHKKFDAADMAKRFTYEYFKQPDRGYGRSVKSLFKRLKKEGYNDPFRPAREAFDGKGSYGNGGAMRIVPAPLFGYNMEEEALNSLVSGITRLTHSEVTAVNGAILQAHAVHYVLRRRQGEEEDESAFLEHLGGVMARLERDSDKKPYCDKLELVKQYLASEESISRETIVETLGNDVSALESVVTAIYCFLRAKDPIEGVETSCRFERCIEYAVTLGGDTDTVASMAGAVAGAALGIDGLPAPWLARSEGVTDARKMARDLYDHTQQGSAPAPRRSKRKCNDAM